MLPDEVETTLIFNRVLSDSPPPYFGGYRLERGGMPLHDAVGINCKKGATAENQGADVKYIWANWCLLVIVRALSDLT